MKVPQIFKINYREKLSPYPFRTPRKLLKMIKGSSGRSKGTITVRHKGGRSKRFYRFIAKRNNYDFQEGTVKSIEYDPFRNCFISLIHYKESNDFAFIIAPEGLKVDDKITSGDNDTIPIKVGNNLPLSLIPANIEIHDLELRPKQGGKIARGAGNSAKIIGSEFLRRGKKYILVKLPSKETRIFLSECRATIGRVGNREAKLVRLTKAGNSRWRGIRPTVRGSAMNPVDHPHGGGEQKHGIGGKPRTYSGRSAVGKTRKPRNITSKYIITSRHQSKRNKA